MEYAEKGEMFEYITERGRLTENEARRMFQQIVCGVESCHRRMIVHRDLKPENILLDHNWTVKIADFGLGNFMKEGLFLKTSCGSPNYAAPEVISGNHYSGPEVDIWGCGVVLYTLLCGRLPFDERNHIALYHKIKNAAYSVPGHVSPAAQNLLSIMLVVNPTFRATFPEIRSHPWFLPFFIPQLLELQNAGIDLSLSENRRNHLKKLRDPSWRSTEEESSSGPDDISPNLHWNESGILSQRIAGTSQWVPGLQILVLEKQWLDGMTKVCLALQELGVKWKKVGPYSLRCFLPFVKSHQPMRPELTQRSKVPLKSRKRPAGQESDLSVEKSTQRQVLNGYHPIQTLRLNSNSHKRSVSDLGISSSTAGDESQDRSTRGITFEIQMYKINASGCLLDLRLVGGSSSLPFFEMLSQFRCIIHRKD